MESVSLISFIRLTLFSDERFPAELSRVELLSAPVANRNSESVCANFVL